MVSEQRHVLHLVHPCFAFLSSFYMFLALSFAFSFLLVCFYLGFWAGINNGDYVTNCLVTGLTDCVFFGLEICQAENEVL